MAPSSRTTPARPCSHGAMFKNCTCAGMSSRRATSDRCGGPRVDVLDEEGVVQGSDCGERRMD
ncbi:hypothetical protein C8Q76DRAFT_719449 [Earliella scabrosa]|nr:hypothetical protein C8Q76DRAFT_719449 [Earliella scabrosa]